MATSANRIAIPPNAPRRSCSSCAAIIYWVVMSTGKKMPVDPDGTSHFATCPNAAEHRAPRTNQLSLLGGKG